MIQTVNATTLNTWINAGEAILIDVREADEFATGHIASAWAVPLSKLDQVLAGLKLQPGQKVVFQCLAGKRGGAACQRVSDVPHMDSIEVYNLEGGITAWREANLPVIGNSQKISIFRQVQMVIGTCIAICVALGFFAATGFFILAGMLATALAFAGVTGWCGLAILLQKMPWNRLN